MLANSYSTLTAAFASLVQETGRMKSTLSSEYIFTDCNITGVDNLALPYSYAVSSYTDDEAVSGYYHR